MLDANFQVKRGRRPLGFSSQNYMDSIGERPLGFSRQNFMDSKEGWFLDERNRNLL